MKVLYIIPYDWGGMPHYTTELANAVSKHEDVALLCSKRLNTSGISTSIEIHRIFSELDFNISNPMSMFSINNFSGLYSYKKLNIIKKINPNIIHFTTPLFPTIPLFISLYGISRNYPIVRTIHSMHQDYNPWMEFTSYIIEHICCNLINHDATIVHTQRDKEHMISSGLISEDKIFVIPHMSFNSFKKYTRNEEASLTEVKYILFFGYIKKYKGLEYLLQAIPLILNEVENIKIIIAGEGDISPYLSFLNDIPESLLEIYNEFIPDDIVATLFQKAKVIVLPYTQMTGMSGIMNIAFAFGKPVVATDVWGFKEALQDGVHGYLVPPKDSKALADAIIKIMNDESLQNEINHNVLIKANEISGENIAKKHIDLYEETIDHWRNRKQVKSD